MESRVESVASQISLGEWTPSASSETCMPMAFDRASAGASTTIPPTTASLEWVPERSPTISPSVVITPDVRPNPRPLASVRLGDAPFPAPPARP